MPKKTKQIIPAKKALGTDKDYQNLLDELKSIIAQGQYQAYKAVDNIKVQTYWQLGSEIAEIIEEYVFVSLQEEHPLPEFKNFCKVA